MAVSGTWTLKFSWGCSTSYSSTTITFAAGGTFTTGSGNSGNWTQVEGTIFWKYNPSGTVYAGNVAGAAMSGGNSTFAGLTGCWYALKSGVTGAVAAKGAKANDAGEKGGSRASKKTGSKKAGGGKK